MSDEVILKAHTIQVATAGSSTQPDDEEWFGTPDDAIEPPEPLERYQELSSLNDVRATCIDAIATNTVGLGYTLTVEEGHEHDAGDIGADVLSCKALLETMAKRDRRLNPNGPSLREQLMAVKTDEEEVGQGYLEVSRDQRTGVITGLYHLPAIRMRRLKSREGYVLLSNQGDLGDRTPFYNFGEKVQYADDGRPTRSLQQGKSWETNEVLVFKLYSSESRDYGLPRDAAMALDYLGDKLASEANQSFFDSSGTPPTIVFVQGEETKDGGRVSFRVPQETADRVASTLKSDGGHRNRVAIVPVPPGTRTDQIKLGEFSDRDVGFVNYRQDVARRTVSSFRLQPIFVAAVNDQGRYTAEVQRAITLEQLFDPEQTRYEDVLGETLLVELGFRHLRLKFRRLAVEDDKTRRDSAQAMGETGTIMRREYRQAHGYGPLPEGTGPGQMPEGWNDQLVETKPPAGAENRSTTTDTRGLTAGIGARPDSQRHQDFLDANQGRTTSGPTT